MYTLHREWMGGGENMVAVENTAESTWSSAWDIQYVLTESYIHL